MTPSAFVHALSEIHLDGVFNPYNKRCMEYDLSNAVHIRRDNLLAIIDAALSESIDSIWIARDLGHRGGRRTGLPLTDEMHLSTYAQIYNGLTLRRATKGPIMAERTAAIVWNVLTQIDLPIFLWNVFPLHPFEPNNPLSNRRHTRTERQACEFLLFTLLEMIKPKKIVAIGKDAQNALAEFNIKCHPVRHPSYGGQKEFISGMDKLYNLGVNPII